MTNFDYITKQIKAGKMNAEQMEEFISNGTFEEFDCDCPECRKKFLGLRYVPLIKPCPFCGSTEIRFLQRPFTEKFYVSCADCGAASGYHNTVCLALVSWNSIRREEDDE